MSEKFSRINLGKSLRGKQLSGGVRKKMKESLSLDNLGSGDAKKKLSQKLANKSKAQRKQVYKDLGFNDRERKNLEETITSGETNEGGGKGLTEKQKRRNIFESRRSAERQGTKKEEKFAGSVGGKSGTRYKESSAQFSEGEVGVSSLVGTRRNPKSKGGFARQHSSGSKNSESGAGFAQSGGWKKKGGEVADSSSSRFKSSGKKPLGF